jgi:hypothetical protein
MYNKESHEKKDRSGRIANPDNDEAADGYAANQASNKMRSLA